MGNYKDLIVFQKAYKLAMDVFEFSKRFPPEERFSLTGQIRKSARSVCANLVEAYRRRKYPAHFVAKLTDASSENAETQLWLDFARDCDYLSLEEHLNYGALNEEVGKMLTFMINKPEKFI